MAGGRHDRAKLLTSQLGNGKEKEERSVLRIPLNVPAT